MSRAREFENVHLHNCEWRKRTPELFVHLQNWKRFNEIQLIKTRYWITRIKGHIQIRSGAASYRIDSCNISDLYLYDAIPHGTIQFITLLPINSIKTIDDKLAMNCLYRLISMPIMLKIYLNGYLHFRYVHTCDLIKLIRIATPLKRYPCTMCTRTHTF